MATAWTRFMALYLLGVIANMCASFQAPLVASLSKAFGVAPNQIGFVMSAQFLAYLFGGSAIGGVVARFGVRRTAQGGVALIVLTMLCNWRATSLIHLVASNLVQGLGMLMVVVAGQVGMTVVSTKETRARVLTIWATAPLLGLALGLMLSSAFADGELWRSAFVVMACIATAAFSICFLLPSNPMTSESTEKMGAGLTAEIGAFRLSIAVALLVMAINGSVSSWPIYLSHVHGTTPGAIGGLSSLAMLTGIVGSLGVGFALGRNWTARRLLGVILPFAMASAVLVFGTFAGFSMAIVAMFLWNLATGAMTALIFATLPEAIRNPGNLPAATGMLYQFAAVGTMLGAPLYLWLADANYAAQALVLVTCSAFLAIAFVFPLRDDAHGGAPLSAPGA